MSGGGGGGKSPGGYVLEPGQHNVGKSEEVGFQCANSSDP